MILQKLDDGSSLRAIPVAGMYLTIVSRSLDALENTLFMVIYVGGYSQGVFAAIAPVTAAKWVFVSLEYGCFLLGVLALAIRRFR